MNLRRIFDLLEKRYGPQHWWPGETPFEVLVGAILVQNTNWKNVEKAIQRLRGEDLLNPQALHALSYDELAELIRPAGYYRVKARRLQNMLAFLFEHYDGSLERMFAAGLERLRPRLLSINGIGPETADSILLYAGNLPTFVVDAYTVRVLRRHGLLEEEGDYRAVQELFHRQLPAEVPLYNEFHALLVRVGKEHCRTHPRCEDCPLVSLLPEGGPIVDG